MIARRIDRRVLFIDGAAKIYVRTDLAALFAARDHMRVDLQPFGLVFDPAGQGLILRLIVSGVKTARPRKSRRRVPRPSMNFAMNLSEFCPSFNISKARCGPCRRARTVEGRLDAGGNLPAIAGAAAKTCRLRVKDDGMPAAARRLQGGVQSRVARANDDDIGARTAGRFAVSSRPRHLIPPVRRRFKVVCE